VSIQEESFVNANFVGFDETLLYLITQETGYDVLKSNRFDRVDINPCMSCSLNATGSFSAQYFLSSSWSSFVIGVALFEAFFLNA